jgi:hypothetical protein
VQGALALRVAIYWVHCLVTVSFMLTIWVIFTGRPQSSTDLLLQVWGRGGPALLASLLLLPLVLFDCLRVSNRFVGPLLRLRRAMREAADGRPVSAINFREDDYWQELADDFNRLCEQLEKVGVVERSQNAEENDEADTAQPAGMI